jgi:hypothetical protein
VKGKAGRRARGTGAAALLLRGRGKTMAISNVLHEAVDKIDKYLSDPIYQERYAYNMDQIVKVRTLMHALQLGLDNDGDLSGGIVMERLWELEIGDVEQAVMEVSSEADINDQRA